MGRLNRESGKLNALVRSTGSDKTTIQEEMPKAVETINGLGRIERTQSLSGLESGFMLRSDEISAD